jgi:hydrogenase maturation protein HypF
LTGKKGINIALIKRLKISITGQVQGVGFRPAVQRIVSALGLTGFIHNDSGGVTIELQGVQEKLTCFPDMLASNTYKPPLAKIRSYNAIEIPPVESEKTFIIRTSDSEGTPTSQVTTDIATCRNCIDELMDKNDFRYGYPFINCTNCGPRYSIIKDIPYDRPNTTMSEFQMCDRCKEQYDNIADRRFHAQPVACAACGPQLWLADSNGKVIENQTDTAISQAAQLLLSGKIVAIKGLGGFHLAADALNNNAVKRLRERKKRDYKPFALMADSIEQIKQYADVNESAKHLLKSPQSPIVILPKNANCAIADSVASGINTLGFMLCYTPLHHLLFKHNITVLVMTSGNISDEPLICKNDLALERLGDVADAFLMHNREIYRQVDDSIVHFIKSTPVLLRRARGYVPTPIYIKQSCPQDILAAGADLKNTFCLARGNQLICSEHIGDLADARVYHHYINSIGHLAKLFEVNPKVVVCDPHPGYLSTQYAHSLAAVKVLQVQHHWAHIASVMAEHNLDCPVIGLVADGTGYGTDGAIWGCECLIASLEKFDRFGRLDYFSLAGGDAASKEAIRPLLSLLKKSYKDDFELADFAWLLARENFNSKLIVEQLERGINCVATSSLGRVFDAVALMLGLGNYNHFDAQLPMSLEAVAKAGEQDSYEFDIVNPTGDTNCINLDKTIRNIISDINEKTEPSVISAKFHNTIAEAFLKLAILARQQTGLNIAAISGGVFCNRFLINHLIELLEKAHFSVYFNQHFPSNDGCICLGQAAIAAKKLSIH